MINIKYEKILSIVYGDNFKEYISINPEKHIPLILQHMKREALNKGYKFIE